MNGTEFVFEFGAFTSMKDDNPLSGSGELLRTFSPNKIDFGLEKLKSDFRKDGDEPGVVGDESIPFLLGVLTRIGDLTGDEKADSALGEYHEASSVPNQSRGGNLE